MKSHLKLVLLILVLSSCNSIYVQLPPDQIPVIGDSELIKVALAKKEVLFEFKYLKSRSSRFPVLREIEKLSKEGLNQFKSGKLSTLKYTEFSELARLGTQIILWFAIIEYNNTTSGLKVISAPSRENINEVIGGSMDLKTILQSTSKEGGNDDILEFLLALRDELKSQLRA